MFSERSSNKEVMSSLCGFFRERTDAYGKNVHALLKRCRCQVDVEIDDEVTDEDYCYWFFHITLFVPLENMELASTREFCSEITRAALLLIEPTSEGDFRTELTIERLDRAESGRIGAARRATRQVAAEIERIEPAESGTVGVNNCFFFREQTILHEGLRFRSQGEIAIFDELKRRDVLFFPNPAAVMGTSAFEYGEKIKKLEPDFLICYKGKWGVLEINGEDFHSGIVKTTKDHERARRLKHYGLFHIEAYDYEKCKADPVDVVDEFLQLLANHK